jgi:hypothetical protein
MMNPETPQTAVERNEATERKMIWRHLFGCASWLRSKCYPFQVTEALDEGSNLYTITLTVRYTPP